MKVFKKEGVVWNIQRSMKSEKVIVLSSTAPFERNTFRKRVNLFGSINWTGDSIHQSLNITRKLIAKKYSDGKPKRTLKKESKELEIVVL